MERLTKREYGEISCTGREIPCSSFCNNCSQGTCDCEIVKDMVKKLAEYEDLEEQGKLLKLPCKVGDIVYEICGATVRGYDWKVLTYAKAYVRETIFNLSRFDNFGTTVFLTKSEAEAKLKELRGNQNEMES